jgi:hypothetical protein
MPQKTDSKFTTCHSGHMRIGYYGIKCPLCASKTATQVIVDEYFKVLGMCGKLLHKLQIKRIPKGKRPTT